MADDYTIERQKYVNDSRIACKYGTKCFQKNPIHQQKYKHPPPKRANYDKTTQPAKKVKLDNTTTVKMEDKTNLETKFMQEDNSIQQSDNTKNSKTEQDPSDIHMDAQNSVDKLVTKTVIADLGLTPRDVEPNEFIKEKFLVKLPTDFYHFWDFCKSLKEKCPQEAFKDVGLILVGPYDVLAHKFNNIPDQPQDKYLIHWRYFHDPPEFQTVLKGDDKTGFHIGYFRDSPKEMPVFLASNCSKTDGIFKVVGDNIFAAVNIYLENMKKTGDPFKKMHVGRFQTAIKKKAEALDLNLSERTQKIKDRDKKIVTRSFNKLGIVIPYNRKTQVGYRDLGVSNKELVKLLDNIHKALPDQRQSFLSKLQDILTNVSIATDECDFGTGIELGLDILAHEVDSLNHTISRYLATNYRLIDKEEFAKIIEAHMANRKKGTNLSIV